jgi:hypothetical protein
LFRLHVERYPMSAVLPPSVAKVEEILELPIWHWSHDQGSEGSCVGHGTVMERAVTNLAQARAAAAIDTHRRYDPIWQWNQAKIVDEWSDTNPGDNNGTSVHAGYDVARNDGVVPVWTMKLVNNIPTPVGEKAVLPADGVSANYWATDVDQMRSAIANGNPVTIGINWYTAFDKPQLTAYRTYFAATDGQSLGAIRGGHCVCIYGASDRKQAFKLKNSWGHDYPLCWLPYSVMTRLLSEEGEATLQVDR